MQKYGLIHFYTDQPIEIKTVAFSRSKTFKESFKALSQESIAQVFLISSLSVSFFPISSLGFGLGVCSMGVNLLPVCYPSSLHHIHRLLFLTVPPYTERGFLRKSVERNMFASCFVFREPNERSSNIK